MNGSEEDPDQRPRARAGDLPPRLADDQFYRALAASHRRRLLHYLLENQESTIEELTSVLSGWEITPAGTMQTQADRSEIRLQLQHNHLPRLADADLINYDTDTGTVELALLHPRVADIIRQSVEAEQRADAE